jgi:hypothetical protein
VRTKVAAWNDGIRLLVFSAGAALCFYGVLVAFGAFPEDVNGARKASLPQTAVRLPVRRVPHDLALHATGKGEPARTRSASRPRRLLVPTPAVRGNPGRPTLGVAVPRTRKAPTPRTPAPAPSPQPTTTVAASPLTTPQLPEVQTPSAPTSTLPSVPVLPPPPALPALPALPQLPG